MVLSKSHGISMMESDDLARVQRIFDKAQQFARSYRRFEMTDEYRALIARVEALPQNQAGADRSEAAAGWGRLPFSGPAPLDPENLASAWSACESVALELWLADEPLARPRDRSLAERVVPKDLLFLATRREALEQLLKKAD